MRPAIPFITALFLALPASAENLRLHLSNVESGPDANGQPALNFTLTPKSAHDFARFTTQQVGQAIDLMIEGETVISPIIVQPITDGQVQISSFWSGEDLHDMMTRLQSGKAAIVVRPAQADAPAR